MQRAADTDLVRVGDMAITQAMIDHWTSVMSAGRAPAHAGGARHRSLQRQVLELLIGRQWLIGQARAERLAISESDIRQRVDEDERALFPGGPAERDAFFQATGETVADLRVEAQAQIAATKLRRKAESEVRRVTRTQAAAYYRRHRQRFYVEEQREVLTTNRKTYAEAAKVRREAEAGKRTNLEVEVRPLPRNPREGNREALENAMRKAVPNTIAGPVKQLAVGTVYDYFVFELKRVIPASYRPFAQVARELAAHLQSERRKRALRRFAQALRARWLARTDCRAGYVVQKCRQYAGPRSPEEPLALE